MATHQDVYQALLGDGIVFLRSVITEEVANNTIVQLLWLDKYRPGKIGLCINSIGGDLQQGLAIYDVIQSLKSPVSTLCMGQALSMAAILLCSGNPGERYALKNSRIMIHQPHNTLAGTESELQAQTNTLKKYRNTMEEIIARHTGNNLEQVHRDCENDLYMSSIEAKNYGLIDHVVTQGLLYDLLYKE